MALVEPILVSQKDAARMLGISARSVRYLIATDRLKTRRMGGRVLLAVAEVRRFAASDHPEPFGRS